MQNFPSCGCPWREAVRLRLAPTWLRPPFIQLTRMWSQPPVERSMTLFAIPSSSVKQLNSVAPACQQHLLALDH